MEFNPETQEEMGTGGKIKDWLQDNIRILLSVLIVVAIAGGIYSYSKRVENPVDSNESAGNEAVTVIGEGENKKGNVQEAQPDQEEAKKVEEQVAIVETEKKQEVATSQETEEAFVEKAVKGDSVTTLARKATKDYLEKNNDSNLTIEHKIFIEDYLRKKVNNQGGVKVGTEISFSKTLIKDAVAKSKTLNDNQLKNLKKYSARVTNI